MARDGRPDPEKGRRSPAAANLRKKAAREAAVAASGPPRRPLRKHFHVSRVIF